jgi:DNA-binding transcriptional MerR regulator
MKNWLTRVYDKKEGEHKKAIKIARNMKDKGMSVNDIAELTELTVDEILRL